MKSTNMLQSQQIKELRQTGKLNEALDLALKDLEENPDNLYAKRNISWVYYGFLKKFAEESEFNNFIINLIKIKELNFPEEEKMIFDNCAWQIGKIIFSLQNEKNVDYGKINELYDITKDFHFTKPSEAYSFIYKAFHKGYKNWPSFFCGI